MPTTLHENRPSAGIGVVEVQKPMVFFAISNMFARPSAGIGVVEVQKPMVFYDFCGARATLCGDRRGRGAKTHGFLRFLTCSRDPLRGSAWSRCKNLGFLRFLTCSRDPLRGSAWSRCKNPWFFAISAVLARPSARIGAVEVQKPMVFCDFCCSNWSSGVVSWFARLLPEPAGRGFDSSWSAGGRRKMQLAF